MLIQFIINGFIKGILYGLSAIGFSLVYNTTRIFHIAAAALYVVAAYAFYFTYHTFGLPIWLSGALALLFTALLSMTCEWLIYRPQHHKKASLNVMMISSIGLTTVLVNIIAIMFGNETKLLDKNIQSIFTSGEIIITNPQLIQLMFGTAAMGLFIFFLRFTKFGLKTKALSNNSILFETLGFQLAKTRTIVFALSGAFLAIGSCLAVYDTGMDPHIGMPLLINAMVAMIIGGIGRFDGCVIGGLSLGILQSLVVYQFSSNWQNAITFIALLLFLFLRPHGIIGYKKRTV